MAESRVKVDEVIQGVETYENPATGERVELT